MTKRRREIDIHAEISSWLEEEEDLEGDDLGELNGDDGQESSGSEEEVSGAEDDNETEERPIMRKVFKKKLLTKKRLVNSIGKCNNL